MTSYATSIEAAVTGDVDAPPGAVCEPAEYQEKRTLPLQEVSSMRGFDDYDCDSQSDGREKADTTPENLRKIDDVIESETVRSQIRSLSSVASEPLLRDESIAKLEMEKSLRCVNDTLYKQDRIESETNAASLPTPLADESSIDSVSTATKQSFAFTIDNFNDKECDPAAAAAKYKSMMERFQSRHRRGASMSKLESADPKGNSLTSPSQSSTTLRDSRSMTKSLNAENSAHNANAKPDSAQVENDANSSVPKVKLRVRDRSTSRVRDSSKRHSWSPRSSTSELPHTPVNKLSSNSQSQTKNRLDAIPSQCGKKIPKSKPPALQMPKDAANSMPSRQQFTPRSTAMQMALQKVDFLCPQPPLADFKHLHIDGDNVSEAGTYTLDGDNYTEEQKDLMNIDKSTLERAQKARKAQAANRPTDLEIPTADTHFMTKIPVVAGNRNNVLEVNYYHDSEITPTRPNPADFMLSSHQTASSYLEKIKSRVLRNMSATKNISQDIDSMGKIIENGFSDKTASEDVGTFTSVTTSGVLAKQSALDPRPRLTRRSSLSTSQIDSSEYVSNEAKLKSSGAAAYSGGGFTDHQKAEYRLNVFTNQKDSQKFGPNRSFGETPPDSPSAYKTSLIDQANLSDTAVLKTAQNKNDWIQEWARNARARSLACDGGKGRQMQSQDLMTRSYTCSEAGESLTDDSLFNSQRPMVHNKSLAERYRLVGEFDYASDPAICSSLNAKSNADISNQRPPKSPSKIPSPLHSIGRARSASRTRSSLQNMLQQDAAEPDVYLQKTAAAINNLQQSLSRKNSLKSPPSGSPRTHPGKNQAYYSPDECSPQHSLESPTGYHPPPLRTVHKRNLSMESYSRDPHAHLMTSSFNEQQLKLLTSGEYMQKSRGRKNSFDGNIQTMLPSSPARRENSHPNRSRVPEQQHSENALSPLRRSSSFSAKIATARSARPQFQNLYTPPAARHNYIAPGNHGPNPIKKSASSNNFRSVYSDYDDNLAYYIKDEDDYGEVEEYYSSGDDLEVNDDYMYGGKSKAEVAGTTTEPNEGSAPTVPLSNTRYNKALLMRIERSKQKVAGKIAGPSSASCAKTAVGGVVACPNTPELPRRTIKSAPRANASRQSMPRDSSLNRLAGQIPNSLASAKKQILQTAAAVPANSSNKPSTARVQPKYLDISKYKPVQGNNFLRKNDAKSTLKTGVESMKRSPSSSSMGISRADPTRASNRSAKSVTSIMTTSGTSLSARAPSAVRRDTSVTKQKEAEMEMWKRRSKYDPMKAAAEDRRKKEEAKKLAQAKNDLPSESETASRDQSSYLRETSFDNQWTMGLRESGGEESE